MVVRTAPALAVVLGSFLTGAMFNISAMIVPVILKTSSDPQSLLTTWARVYELGIRTAPPLAIGTMACYAYSIWQQRAARRPWGAYAAAAALTMSIVPFTWIVMESTNASMFRAEASGRWGWEEAVGSLKHWTVLHTTRTLLPAMGVGIGLRGLKGDGVF